MRDTDDLADLLSESFLSLLREKEDFFEFECDSYRMGFEIIAAAMSKALERFDDELFNAKPPSWKVKEKVWREPMSEVGQLFFKRRIYIDDVGDRRCMLDEVLDLPKGMHVTPGAFDKLTGFGVQTSYHATARLFNRHIEGGITAQSAMNALRTSAAMLKKDSERKARRLFRDGEAPEAETAESRVFLEADGVWVPMQARGRDRAKRAQPRSFEVKAMVAYSGKEGGARRRRRCDRVVFDAVTNPESFWRQGVSCMAEKFDLGKVEKVVLGADGGGWCGKAGDYLPSVEVQFKLDQYHVNKSIVSALKSKRDRAEAFHLLYGEGVGATVEFLESVPSSRSNASLQQTIGYLKNFEGDIDPHGFSLGTMESTNAHVIGSRMKSLGGAWSAEGGNAMARARAHVANGRSLPRPHSPSEVEHKMTWKRVRDARRRANAEACGIGESAGFGEQERVLSWHSDSMEVRERIKLALSYKSPSVVPAPFRPSVQMGCPAHRTHAWPDALGRTWGNRRDG